MNLIELIGDLPMFQALTTGEKKKFAELKHFLQEFKRGDTIIREGDTSTSIYLLIKGTVLVTKTMDEATIRLGKLNAGEIFGEMSFFQKKPRRSNVVANDHVLALKMDDTLFSRMSPDVRDKIKNYFIELLIKRLDEMNASLMNVARLMRG